MNQLEAHGKPPRGVRDREEGGQRVRAGGRGGKHSKNNSCNLYLLISAQQFIIASSTVCFSKQQYDDELQDKLSQEVDSKSTEVP